MRGIDWIGWVATALFLLSYRCRSQSKLRLTQAAAALLWMVYGAVLQAVPIVVANLLVAAVAVYTSRNRPAAPQGRAAVTPAAAPDLSGIS
jgi:hypothetical protein